MRCATSTVSFALGLLLVITSAGCGGSHAAPDPPPGQTASPSPTATATPVAGISVTIDPPTAHIKVGQTQQFSVTVTNTANTAVTWSVNGVDGGNSTAGTISAAGLYTAPGTLPSGAVSVTATSAADPSQSSTATLTVTAYTGMLRYHNDPGITGQNLNETALTPGNVNAAGFGKLFSYALDGQSFAQPLYVADVPVSGKGTHNVIYAATEHDSVYAFDADAQATLWSVNFTKPSAGITTIPASDLAQSVGGSPITPEIGITSTPVIDGNTGTLYVLAATKENGAYVHSLHALDITSGAEKFGGPVVIRATASGIPFDSLYHLQRPALLLSNGIVYLCFGSFSDWGPYHGWLIAYEAVTLHQAGVWNTTPNGQEGAIWMAGAALSVDHTGEIYGIVANGTFDPANGNYGNTFFKLDPGTLSIDDYFTPFNQQALQAGDIDIGSAGFTLLPDQPGPFPHLGISAGKEGRIYVVNIDDLGKFQAGSDSQIVQSIPNALGDPNATNSRNFSTAAYWQGNIYFVANHDVIKQYTISNGQLSTSPAAMGSYVYPYPGANMSISANGATNGIVWTIEAGGVNVLHAYDAANVAHELYNSGQSGSRDTFGTAVRFTVPTVVNGKVYVAGQTQLAVFGLR